MLSATVPALVVGVLAGRAWRRGSAGVAALLAFGLPVLAWFAFVVAVGGGEGMAELAILGWLVSTVCAAAAAGLTAFRRPET